MILCKYKHNRKSKWKSRLEITYSFSIDKKHPNIKEGRIILPSYFLLFIIKKLY